MLTMLTSSFLYELTKERVREQRWRHGWTDQRSEERNRWKRKRIVLHKEAVYFPAWNGEHKRRCQMLFCSAPLGRRIVVSGSRNPAFVSSKQKVAPLPTSSTSMQQITFKTYSVTSIYSGRVTTATCTLEAQEEASSSGGNVLKYIKKETKRRKQESFQLKSSFQKNSNRS